MVQSDPFIKVWYDMVRLLAFMEDDEDGVTPEERLYQARDLLQIIEKNHYRALNIVDIPENRH
jgi:hypothetical protein